MKRTVLAITVGLFVATFAGTAAAEEASASVSVSSPSSRVTAVSAEETGDHAYLMEHEKPLAVGFFGVEGITIAKSYTGTGDPGTTTIPAPIVGARYWFSEKMAVDVGVGFNYTSLSQSTTPTPKGGDPQVPGAFAFLVHGGLPIALSHGKHYTFEVIPELNVGAGGSSRQATGVGTDTVDGSASGFQFDLGGRIGAEIYFGFIGIPQLALEGSIGLGAHYASVKTSAGNNSVSSSSFTLGTEHNADPWALFTNSIAAFYYF